MNGAIDQRIRILLVSNRELVRKGFQALLNQFEEMEVVGDVSLTDASMYLLVSHVPDVVLVDPDPDCTGIADCIKSIRRRYSDTNVVVISHCADEQLIASVLKAGATSFLTKDLSVNEFISDIRAVNLGRSVLSPDVTAALIHLTVAPPNVGHDLTVREREVLSLVACGLHNGDIADMLKISYSTVQFHVSSIFAKLSVNNRVEAAALAIKHGLVE